MSSVGEALKQAMQVIAAQKAWIYAVPLDTPLPAMPGFDREWADGVELALKDAIAAEEAQGVKSVGEVRESFPIDMAGTTVKAAFLIDTSLPAGTKLFTRPAPAQSGERAALIERLRDEAVFDIDRDAKSAMLEAANMLAADAESDCARSHPHENMSKMCELRTDIARLQNERKRKVNDALTDRKTDSIIERGYQHTGYVLRHPDTGERAIIESQAVRWVKADDMAVIMHREGRIQRQPMTSEQIKAAIFGVLSGLEVAAPNCQHWDEYAAGEIAKVFETPGAA